MARRDIDPNRLEECKLALNALHNVIEGNYGALMIEVALGELWLEANEARMRSGNPQEVLFYQ